MMKQKKLQRTYFRCNKGLWKYCLLLSFWVDLCFKLQIQPAGPRVLVLQWRKLLLWITVLFSLGPPGCNIKVRALPCSVTPCSPSVASIFPAAVPQGAQGSQALWRSQQTTARKNKTALVNPAYSLSKFGFFYKIVLFLLQGGKKPNI